MKNQVILLKEFNEWVLHGRLHSKSAPRRWWDRHVKSVKSGNPKASEESIKRIVGSIWSALSTHAKSKARQNEGKTYGKAKPKK